MRTITEQTKTNPVLADAVIEQLKVALGNLAWLDQVFGRAWTIDRGDGKKKIYEPCIYTAGNSYETLIPSADLGNYSFFVLMDATRVDEFSKVISPFALIVWYDISKCFTDGGNCRDTENLKADILDVLRTAIVRGGSVTVTKVYEEPKNVYKGYTLDESVNRFMTQPYGAMRIEGEIVSNYQC